MVVSAMRNVLITGTPRSGTTLVCSLLNKLPDTVALHEPMNVWDFPKCADPEARLNLIEAFFAKTRASLHERGIAVSKHVGGVIPDNVAANEVARGGSRIRRTEHGPVVIEKSLSENFLLAIKHPVAFTAMLGTLCQRFECFAIIRNPLAMLASWNSLGWLDARDGHVPIGEKLDEQLRRHLDSEPDRIERQLYILEWFYKNFREFLPRGGIVKYEDLIASRGRALAEFFPAAGNLHDNLSSKNVSNFYDHALMVELGNRLLRRSGVIWDFYNKRDVENLLAEVASEASVTLKP